MNATPPFSLAAERLATAYPYAGYRKLIDDLLLEGRTTGPNQGELYEKHTRMNVQRMKRLDKTIQLRPELIEAARSLPKRYVGMVLTEAWCGDAAQLVPIFEAVAQASSGALETRYLLRDENPDVMDAHLTKGGRAIPKLLLLDAETRTEVADWGPRPEPAQALYWRLKDADASFDVMTTELHTWYAHDRTQTTQAELWVLLQDLARSGG